MIKILLPSSPAGLVVDAVSLSGHSCLGKKLLLLPSKAALEAVPFLSS